MENDYKETHTPPEVTGFSSETLDPWELRKATSKIEEYMRVFGFDNTKERKKEVLDAIDDIIKNGNIEIEDDSFRQEIDKFRQIYGSIDDSESSSTGFGCCCNGSACSF